MAICKNKECGKRFKPEFSFQKGCCHDCMIVIGMDAVKKKREKELSKPMMGGAPKIPSDVLGSYTGVSRRGEMPVQDADDL